MRAADRDPLLSKAGKGMGSTNRIGDGDPPKQAGSVAKAKNMARHPLLSVEQMRHAADIHEQAIQFIDLRRRSPASDGKQSQTVQERSIALRICIPNIQIRHQGPGMRQRHPRVQTGSGCSIIHSRKDHPLLLSNGRHHWREHLLYPAGNRLGLCRRGHGAKRIVGNF
ncbi:hypothetical protein CP98_04037 [Sphingobium yanoikuyae]|jgi:hypothetical protein|uniref:Uncharacterized protein n=1 Tax=Sphingobium yanoikuyae TaxID=13690 RepID=A0A084EF67_SPHYA|nr:hypothetical protein CP98_04037 [Sphingobium yanoikuyae]MDG5973210.1 hypothetical protein [Sphingomonas paucimobilis]|tara:strand:+ start:494 stop:997 length:504 start_codon:yes stop_codon:yes gene_type:complete